MPNNISQSADLQRACLASRGNGHPTAGPGSTIVREEMCPALAEVCGKVRLLFSRNDARDALDRYAIGCIIRDVRDAQHTYGQHSVGKIARAVGRDVDTLYEYADVAETWSEVEVARLLERKTPAGVPLSFTHLVVLSKIRRRRDLLKEMTDRALAGISARHLRAVIEEHRAKKQEPSKEQASIAALKRLVACCDRLQAASNSLDETLRNMESVSATAPLAELLKQAQDTHEHLTGLCRQNAVRLEHAHTRMRSDLASEIAEESSAA